MAELDDRLLCDLARLRARSSPPPGAEQRVRAALETTLWPGPDGGPGGEAGGSTFGDGASSGGLGSVGISGSAKVALGAKVIAATAAIGAGALLINLGVMSVQVQEQDQAREAATTPIEVSITKISNDEARSEKPQLEPEPPILVTPPAAPPVPVQRPSEREREREEDPLTAEVTLLEQARATNDPTARLKLLEQHLERFKTGHLAAERETLRISTLCELDRLDAARQATEAFLLAHPRSPLRMRMRNACPELDLLAD